LNAPQVWILFPGIAAIILFLLRRWYRSTVLAGVLLACILALLAWILPVGKMIELGPWTFQVDESFFVFGRRFFLENGHRPLLTMVYLLAAFWFGGAYVARAGRMLVPLGLAVVALLTAALAVEPFLYAALFVEMAVLVSVPILLIPGKPISRGILRFIILETIGMPFILFTDWMLTGVETSPGDIGMVMRAAGILGLGFMFLLAIVPFHTWVPMLAEDSHPYAVAFVLILLPWMIFLFGLGFLDRYTWLRSNPQVFELLRLAGVLMVLTGGIGAAFQRHLGRILGFAFILESGFTLLSAGIPGGTWLSFVLLFPRALAFGVWSLAMAYLWNQGLKMDYHDLHGIGRRMPVVAAAMVFAQFSLAGFPLLAGFPTKLVLWDQVAALSGWQALFSLLGSIGLFATALRSLSVFVTGPEDHPWKITESWQSLILLGVGLAALLLVGLFPQLFLPSLINGLDAFSHLAP
jgi:NADH-quinone oxidoreductase subunit N